MRRNFLLVLVLIATTLVGCQKKPGIVIDEIVMPPFEWQQIRVLAVLEFTGEQPWPQAGRYLSDSLEDRLARQSPYEVLPRQVIDARLAEHNLTMSEAQANYSPVAIGRLIGADTIIMGAIEQNEHFVEPLWPNNKKPAADDPNAPLPVRYGINAVSAVRVRLVDCVNERTLYSERYVGEAVFGMSPLQYVTADGKSYYQPSINAAFRDMREIYPYSIKDPRLVAPQLQQPRPAEIAPF